MPLVGQDVVEVELTFRGASQLRPGHFHCPMFAILVFTRTNAATNCVGTVSAKISFAISNGLVMLVEVGVSVVGELVAGPLFGEGPARLLLEFLLHSVRSLWRHVTAIRARTRTLVFPRVLIPNDVGLWWLWDLYKIYGVFVVLQGRELIAVFKVAVAPGVRIRPRDWLRVDILLLTHHLRAWLLGLSESEVGEVGSKVGVLTLNTRAEV